MPGAWTRFRLVSCATSLAPRVADSRQEMFLQHAADPGWNRIHELPTMGTGLEVYEEPVEKPTRAGPPIAIFGIWTGGRRRPFDARLLRVPVGQCRHLLSTVLGEVISEFAGSVDRRAELLRMGQALICGHGPDGGKVEGPHVAVLALPSILGPYPDGRVRRLALEGVVANLHGRELVDDGKGTGVVLRRETDAGWLALLTGEATEWESVTPMVLDRPEFVRKDWKGLGHADLRRAALAGDSRAALELGRSLATRRESLVREALDRMGLGHVCSVELTRAPWRAGMYPSVQYRANSYLKASPRFHVRVSFRESVRGPLVVGRGRYVGLGLLRPAPG